MHVRQKLSDQWYNAIYNILNGKFASQGCNMSRIKTTLFDGCNFVSGCSTRYTRMRSSWANVFCLMKQHWSRWGKKLKSHVLSSQWTPWTLLLVHQSAELRSAYLILVGILNTCSSPTYVAAILFCVYRIWAATQLFKYSFCTLKYIHFWAPLYTRGTSTPQRITA